jgi:hypothetical protein
VAPTRISWVPPLRIPVDDGVLVKEPTVIVFDPLVRVIVPGRVIEYVEAARPVTVNFAGATVPVVTGRVTPPVWVREPEVGRTTVPGIVGLTATLPKFISTDLVIAIGVIIVADVDAVALTCAKEAAENPKTATAMIINFFMFFCF